MTLPKDYHEQRLRSAIYRRTHSEPGSVNDRIPPEFVSCSDDGLICTVRYNLKPEQRNPMGWLHGGVMSAMVDMGMGLLCYYHAGFALCPTGSMTVNFLRPGRIGGSLMVQSEIVFQGRKLFHTTARCWMEDAPEKLVATATATYIITRPPQSEPAVLNDQKEFKKNL